MYSFSSLSTSFVSKQEDSQNPLKTTPTSQFDTDIEKGLAAAFTTASGTGEPLPDGGDDDIPELKWRRTETNEAGETITVVTYAFDKRMALEGVTQEELESTLEKALQTWANHAPIKFVEIEDPGYTKGVDILFMTDNIDGPQGKLALAYYPKVGDIYFDSDDSWPIDKLLEAAVHEIGHSLGLAHENRVDAIMNPFFEDRYEEGQEPFLFQDDIDGIQHLYGEGEGSVNPLDGGEPAADAVPDPQPEAENLIINGSFEESSVTSGDEKGFRSIKGWQTINSYGFKLKKTPFDDLTAADGDAWAELDAYQRNNTFGQNIDTVTGQRYTLSFQYHNDGTHKKTSGIKIFWDGKQLDKITGIRSDEWTTHTYEVVGSKRNVSTLAFRAIGKSDDYSGRLDDVVLTKVIDPQPLTIGQTNTVQKDSLISQASPSLYDSFIAGVHPDAAAGQFAGW